MKPTRTLPSLSAAALALALLAAPIALRAQTVPGFISYQGHVSDAGGAPLGNRFTSSVNDVLLFLRTYSHSGN